MIAKFCDWFLEEKAATLAWISQAKPNSYDGLFKRVCEILAAKNDAADNYNGAPDPERISVIDHGHYQGTRCFVVADKDYQPHQHWACLVNYGSCSGCDALQALLGYSDDPLSEDQVTGIWTLMLHMVQSLKPMADE